MEQFTLVSKIVRNDDLSEIINHNDVIRTTTAFVDESNVFGRDKEKDFLLSKLSSTNTEQVISIVGGGGLGKTTLAQLVYNIEEIKDIFGNNRIWVCVSNPFDEVKVAQGILECLKVDHKETKNLQSLHQTIRESISKVKFLLVLDDVWDENPGKWERLCLCLKVGDPESRILLTTRKEEVAIVMGTAPSNILKPRHISDDNCWLIMRQRAFQGKSNGKKNELENIGKKIAEKCKGLPLAAKTLGAMLISKDFAEDWREVLNSKMWELVVVENELVPHIFLSYQELPSALKRCFSILALFPKDSNIPVEQVIQIWMANGFLYPRSHVEEMVKTGEKYLDFLVSRAFLEADDTQRVATTSPR
ncbi:antimicrobial response protein [Lithospermum erythrorhizon]|uniref:Antimicrobial response protein n=1 Tax=Lithospermum erythrorhizon TaxID=34254 RepID=A0AAV3P7T4_LITER